MFMREKPSGNYRYLQVVHNRRVNGKVKQEVIATLGRVDVLKRTGQIDGLLASGSRFASRALAWSWMPTDGGRCPRRRARGSALVLFSRGCGKSRGCRR